MPKIWKFLIFSLDDMPVGTDSLRVAKEYALVEENCVVDTSNCTILQPDGENVLAIPEQTLYNLAD